MMQNHDDPAPSGPEDEDDGVEVFVRNLDNRIKKYTIISSTTTDDLAELFGVPPAQVYFVYQGTTLTNATLQKVPQGDTIDMMGRLRGGSFLVAVATWPYALNTFQRNVTAWPSL